MEASLASMLQQVSNATGIPIAVFRNGEILLACGAFEPNPALAFQLFCGPERIGAFCTIAPAYLFIGCVRCGPLVIAAGPVSGYEGARRVTKDVLALFHMPMGRQLEATRWLRAQPSCNLQRFHDVLRLLGGILGLDAAEEVEMVPWRASAVPVRPPSSSPPMMLEMDQRLENAILLAVETGDEAALERILLLDHPAASDFGHLAEEAIRSMKNTFIMTTSIVSRAAIRGGLDYATAILRADEYLLQIEQLKTYPEILAYIRYMFLDYARLVARSRQLSCESALVSRVSGYVLMHLGEPIRTADIAAHVHMNRSYLCRHFHQKTGRTISDYVTEEKVKEARRLLAYTTTPIAGIAAQLGFATQNYFITVFRKATGATPAAFRREGSVS